MRTVRANAVAASGELEYLTSKHFGKWKTTTNFDSEMLRTLGSESDLVILGTFLRRTVR